MICKYVILFTICSVIGWVFESLFAVVKTKKWEARGFLYGPTCPIYGVGVVAIVLAAKAGFRYVGLNYEWWHVALFSFFGSMVLEYVTSYVLEKLFHAYWWDYSDMPLNINGRTCIPAALLFTFGGLGAVYIISPWWDIAMEHVPYLLADIASYAIVAVFAIDTAFTISSLTEIQEQLDSATSAFHTQASAITSNVVDKTEEAANRVSAQVDHIKDDVIKGSIGNMSNTVRATLSRIEGFRFPSQGKFRAEGKANKGAGTQGNTSTNFDFSAFANSMIERVKKWKQ